MYSSGEFGTALLSLRLHPLQSELATGQLLRALEQVHHRTVSHYLLDNHAVLIA
jgi:hypothetical protein